MVLKKGPRALLRQGALSTKTAWWALRRIDDAFVGRVEDTSRFDALLVRF